MIRVSVSTLYEFTEEGYEDYLQTLPRFMEVGEVEEFCAIGKLTRVSVDPDGSKATTTHEVLK